MRPMPDLQDLNFYIQWITRQMLSFLVQHIFYRRNPSYNVFNTVFIIFVIIILKNKKNETSVSDLFIRESKITRTRLANELKVFQGQTFFNSLINNIMFTSNDQESYKGSKNAIHRHTFLSSFVSSSSCSFFFLRFFGGFGFLILTS